MPYLLDAVVLLKEGEKPEQIDAAATAFGMLMGPIELADYVGLDICLDVADRLKSEVEQPPADMPAWLREKVERGDLGRKTGRGFHEYERGKPRKGGAGKGAPAAADDRLQDVLVRLLNACVTCLDTGVVSDERILDGAMVFATGFAPFRGGPLHFARARAIEEVIARLRALERGRGARFAPDPDWENLS